MGWFGLFFVLRLLQEISSLLKLLLRRQRCQNNPAGKWKQNRKLHFSLHPAIQRIRRGLIGMQTLNLDEQVLTILFLIISNRQLWRLQESKQRTPKPRK